MLMHYMLSQGTHPYHADIESNICDDKPNLTVNNTVALDLVQRMLTANPDDRPSMEDLCR